MGCVHYNGDRSNSSIHDPDLNLKIRSSFLALHSAFLFFLLTFVHLFHHRTLTVYPYVSSGIYDDYSLL